MGQPYSLGRRNRRGFFSGRRASRTLGSPPLKRYGGKVRARLSLLFFGREAATRWKHIGERGCYGKQISPYRRGLISMDAVIIHSRAGTVSDRPALTRCGVLRSGRQLFSEGAIDQQQNGNHNAKCPVGRLAKPEINRKPCVRRRFLNISP